MDPRVQYVKTADGVNIAYYEIGQGVPYVYLGAPFTHLTAEWRGLQSLLAGIASTARLVRFDPRGFGLSDRHPADLSLEGFTLDVEAVADRLELRRFVLQGVFVGSLVAVNYAARHPDRLTHLVLVEAVARVPALVSREMQGAVSSTDDWRYVSEALVRFFQGWDQPGMSARFAELLREAVDLDELRSLFDSFLAWDVTDLLPHVTTPAVIVNGNGNPWAGVQTGRELAAHLPNAQLAIVSGKPYDLYQAEAERAVRSFLGAPQVGVAPVRRDAPAWAEPSRTAIIFFADVADSTALTERIGDAAFRERARALDGELRRIIAAAGGTTIDAKTLGDGVLATFASAAQAIEAALACGAAGDTAGLPLHLGLHAGDVIREDSNVFGGAVNIAARISGLAAPGELLVSDVVRALARTSAGVSFADRGQHALKGVADPQRVYAVRKGLA